jgi:hypothetical protein
VRKKLVLDAWGFAAFRKVGIEYVLHDTVRPVHLFLSNICLRCNSVQIKPVIIATPELFVCSCVACAVRDVSAAALRGLIWDCRQANCAMLDYSVLDAALIDQAIMDYVKYRLTADAETGAEHGSPAIQVS